ncbi:MAG TPA: hypothetical protein VL137_15725, partial [Polyangiaceae bacterium]|nr:hypothetical protein [Polyangiaceae bacterium]
MTLTTRLRLLVLLTLTLGGCANNAPDAAKSTSPVAASPSTSTRTATTAAPSPSGISGEAAAQMQALLAEKKSRTPAQAKLDSHIVLEAKRRRGDPALSSLSSLKSTLKLSEAGMLRVDIKGTIDDALIAHIKQLGGSVIASVPRFHQVQADMPIDALEILAADKQVHSIMPALGMTTRKVDTSEGDVAHRANLARSTYSLNGSGITIGVMSDGVDSLAARQASGDLPGSPQLTVLPGRSGSGDEGTAMMEIVYDLAPGAKIIFATAYNTEAEMAQNILDLRTAGANIIVDDVAYFAEAAFQDGAIAQAVDTVTASGALYFSSAGNDGNLADGTASGYEGDYSGTTIPSVLNDPQKYGPPQDVHNFGGTSPKADPITKDPPVLVTLQWSDPFGASNNDYDLFLLNSALTAVVDASTGSQTGLQDPLEYLDSSVRNDNNRSLVVGRYAGSARMLRLSTHGGRVSKATNGQIWGHCAAANSFAVAAVDANTASGGAFVGGATNPFETFTSDGPRRVFYDSTGAAITPGNFLSSGGKLRQKPELTAADGVS